MAITEQNRHQLYTRLEELLGREEATVLMEHLPPVGWADVATKRDLDHLEQRMDLRFEKVDARFDEVETRFDLKLDALADRFDAKLERGLREQESRFLVKVGAVLTLLVAVQAVVQQLIG